MSDIPSAANKVQIEATLDRKPVSQDLLQIMGGSINYLLDQFASFGFQYQLFTANGTWLAPANTNSVILFGCGGGGSGSAWRDLGTSTGASIFYGGDSAKPQWNIQTVTPGQTYTINIGAGGSGVTSGISSNLAAGNPGTSTLFKIGATTLIEYVGGNGGVLTQNIYLAGLAVNPSLIQGQKSANFNPGSTYSVLGGDSTTTYYALGGNGGPFGVGGNGANPTGGTAAANTGAGGGAAYGFGSNATSGAGGSGLLYVIWF